MPRPITLSQDQVNYLVDQINAEGATKRPPYSFVSYVALITKLNTVVEGEGVQIPESVNTKNGWQNDVTSFQAAVAHVIHETNKDWIDH